MPNPKSGKAGSSTVPADPGPAVEADDADPGKVSELKQQQQESGTGKYGARDEKPHKKDPKKKSWIETKLVDEDDHPVPDEAYAVQLPDGSTARGRLDSEGLARIEGIDPGQCKVTFPELAHSSWDPA